MKKTAKRWVSFDFGISNVDETKSPRKKRNTKSNSCGESVKCSDIPIRTFDFHASLRPKRIEDVAVHPKKLKELEEWLQNNVKCRHFNQNERNTTFLLLTGPTGCGKTAALAVLCTKLGITLSEWTSPLDQDTSDFSSRSTQMERFMDFLTESKWKSLFETDEKKKVILVEDFPNFVVHRPEEFFNILEDCTYKTKCPIVFICTDSITKNGIQLSRVLFPQEIRDKYSITNISFNACADTMMKNVLKRAQSLAEQNSDLFKIPNMTTITAIIASSMGDIRCAVNQYYLAALLSSKSLPLELVSNDKPGSKRKRGSQVSKVVAMNRDESLGLFHGLGRVLNPKRIITNESWRLNCDITKLIDEFITQPSTFTAFLFENYIRYFGDITELSEASDMLSLSQLFLERWFDRSDTMIYALWIAVLGIMITNEHRISRWNPIQGPRKIDTSINIDLKRAKLPQTDLCYYNIINRIPITNKFKLKW